MSEAIPSTETTTDTAPPADPLAALDATSIVGDAKGSDPSPPQAADPANPDNANPDDKPAAEGDGKPVAGAPEIYDLKMPDGVTLNAEAWKAAEPIFKEANIGPDQAQKLAEAFPAIAKTITDQAQAETVKQVATIRKEWADQVRTEQGANFDANQAVVAKARDTFMTPEDMKFLADTGLGNSPMMFNLLLKVGQAIGEGSIHTGMGGVQAPVDGVTKMYGPGWGPKANA